jgi:hypothetical protein
MHVRAVRQLLAIAIGLSLWSLVAWPGFWALALAYVAAVVLLSMIDAQRFVAQLPRTATWTLLSLALAGGVLGVARAGRAFVEQEGLEGLSARVSDRLRLEATPSIAPMLVVADRPQTFFVRAAEAEGTDVRVQLGLGAKALHAEAVGQGLFRVDYDPRRDGAPQPHDGTLRTRISWGDHGVERELRAVTPLAHPRWLALSPDRTRVATVSEETDELVLASGSDALRAIRVGDGPTDAVFLDRTRVAIAHRDDETLWILDTEQATSSASGTAPVLRGGAALQQVRVGAQQTRLAWAPNAKLLAVARASNRPEVVLVDGQSARVVTRIALPAAPDWIAFGADDSTLVVATRTDAALHRLRKHDDGTWSEDARLALGRPAVTLARGTDGARVFVAVTDYERDGRAHLGNHFVQDQILSVDIAAFRVTRSLLTARRSERQSKPGDVDRGVSPLGLAQARDGALLIAFAGTDEIWRVRDGEANPEMIDVGNAGLYAPHGIAELADGTLVVSSPAAGAIGLIGGEAHATRVLRLAPSDEELLRRNQAALARRLGERGFYEATRAGISCQSCHLHADSDERAHNLGDHRLLPTLSVRGLAGTGPYLRDGSYPRLSDLDHVAQMLYRGYLRRTPGRPQTLEAYVAGLPRRENPRPASERTPQQEQRGARVFARAGCPSCHAAPAFSGLGQHLLRSVFPDRAASMPADEVIDAPSLLSLAASAPYLNDGRAATLREVLTEHNRANQHGNTARMSESDRADLIAFLESL